MKLFEELMDKTAKFADEAVKVGKEAFEQTKVVAGEAVEKGKKKVNQLQLESDLREAQRRLGALVYLQHKTGEKDEELVAQYVAEVEKIEKALEDLKNADVNEETDYTFTDFKEDTVEIVDDIVEEVKEAVNDMKQAMSADDIRVCPSCSAHADDNDIFCRECGSKLN